MEKLDTVNAIDVIRKFEDYISITSGDYGISLGGSDMIYVDKKLLYALGKAQTALLKMEETRNGKKTV